VMRLPLKYAHRPVAQFRQIWFLFGQLTVWERFGVWGMFMTNTLWLTFRGRGDAIRNNINPVGSDRGKQGQGFRFTGDRVLARHYHLHSGRGKSTKKGALR
jgi:hypothetical protein